MMVSNNNNVYNDVFNELQDYMLDEENIQKCTSMKLVSEKRKFSEQKQKQIYVKPQDLIVIPNHQDSLFWCFYIIKNGEANYESLYNKNSLVTKQMKIELIDTIRKNKSIIKTYKFDTITNIENNLANDNNINSNSFLALCAIENINIIYIKKKTYYESLMNDSDKIYMIHEIPAQSKYCNKYGYELATEDTLKNIRTTLYKLDTINKPIKAISAYKVQDLINMCTKLAIEISSNDTGKSKSKKDLYESIVQYF